MAINPANHETIVPDDEGVPELRLVTGTSFEPRLGPLIVALAKASAGFSPIERTREVTVRPRKEKEGALPYTFHYAPLDVLIAATRPALSANGLVIVQTIHSYPGGEVLLTRLLHESGAMLSSMVPVGRIQGLQDFGSELTYLRRYTYGAILSLAAEEDDDGNRAEGNATPGGAKDRAQGGPPSDKQLALIDRKLGAITAGAEGDRLSRLRLAFGEEATWPETKGEASVLIDKLGELERKAAPAKPAAAPATVPASQAPDGRTAPASATKLSYLRRLARERLGSTDDASAEAALRKAARMGGEETIAALTAQRAESLIQYLRAPQPAQPKPAAASRPAAQPKPAEPARDTEANRAMTINIVKQLAAVVAAHPDPNKRRDVLEDRDGVLCLIGRKETALLFGSDFGPGAVALSDLDVNQLDAIHKALGREIAGRE